MSGFESLDPCVHCGFCLPACPTYAVTGDEADSPRGRIVLMRALERGDVAATDAALLQHLDACLGCRGCEPVCPSGVGYGRGLETARELLHEQRGLGWLARVVLAVFGTAAVRRPLLALGRLLRKTGLPGVLAADGPFGFAMGMLAATAAGETRHASPATSASPRPAPFPPTTIALFRGCVMDDLFDHVHDATRRTLEVNGYRVVEVSGQVCCGALHEHAGDRRGAERLARRNIASFVGQAELIVVNSAGCGALLKDYGRVAGSTEARQFAERVRDVSELLADRGPMPGAELPIEVAYDAPCHLMHAQKVHDQVLAVLRAVPSLRLRLLPGFDRCCGSAGIYSLLEPAMSRAVLEDKLGAITAAEPRPAIIATGNPGCVMQIGAGVRAAGLDIEVRHPVELLDWSYRLAGLYH